MMLTILEDLTNEVFCSGSDMKLPCWCEGESYTLRVIFQPHALHE
jgi:hypothetical protein